MVEGEEVKNASAPVQTVKAKTIHVTVEAGEAREFPISVFAGCSLEYSFHTKGGDIGFGIILETPQGDLKTVLEREKVNAHEEALNGKIRCTQNGTLWFMWDNSHSWFTAKELVYSVTRQPSNTTKGNESNSDEGHLSSEAAESPREPEDEVVPPPPPLPDKASRLETEETANFKVSRQVHSSKTPLKIVLGTMTMASQVDFSQSVEMINRFLALNSKNDTYHELDTARMYNKGQTEILLGEILKQNKNILEACNFATKANPFKGFNENLRPSNVQKQLNDSLQALQKQSIDIFYLHSPDHQTEIEETLKAVNELHVSGKFKRFGLSNYASWEVMEIWHICQKHGWIKPSIYQGMYNAITREVEAELLPCLRRLGIQFYVYNPLAGGLLSGKHTGEQTNTETLLENTPKTGRFSGFQYEKRYWKRDYLDAVFYVQNLCSQQNITLCEASLRWLVWHSDLDSKYKDAVIVGASNMDHLEQNMAALSFNSSQGPLPNEIVKAFDKAWKVCKGSCPKYNR